MKTRILGTGLTGLVGSRLVENLKDKYNFENLSLETGVDISKRDEVVKRIKESSSQIILHLAAKADVDSCEEDKKLGKEGNAWKTNVEGTRNIIEGARANGKKIIYISTDFVFDGEKKAYMEEDSPNPINWYGLTKLEGENIVKESGLPFLICRLAFPYRSRFDQKKDFLRGIMERLKSGQTLSMVEDQMITPTFIDDISRAIDVLVRQEALGIYHIVGGSSHTPLEISLFIAEIFGLDKSLIKKTTREVYFANRAPRPFSLVLKNDKLRKLGVVMSSLEQGLSTVKKQLLQD